MGHVIQILLGMLAFTGAAHLLRGVPPALRRTSLSLAAVLVGGGIYLHVGGFDRVTNLVAFSILVVGFWALTRYAPRAQVYLWLVLFPILVLVVLKRSYFLEIIGLSYAMFRVCSLGMEIIQGRVQRVPFLDFVGFLFNPLTFFVGPINSFSHHLQWLDGTAPKAPFDELFLRVSRGLFKVLLLGPALYQVTLPYLLSTGTILEPVALPICTLLFLFYIYVNFSGFNDVSIALGGMVGMPILENFGRPFLQTNPADFWRHWHMTLSHLARDMVFGPLSMLVARRFPKVSLQVVLAFSILVSFLLIGLWHGVSSWMALFGLYNGMGVLAATLMKDRWPAWWKRFGRSWYGKPILCFGTTSYIAIGATTLGLSRAEVQVLLTRIFS